MPSTFNILEIKGEKNTFFIAPQYKEDGSTDGWGVGDIADIGEYFTFPLMTILLKKMTNTRAERKIKLIWINFRKCKLITWFVTKSCF